MGKKIIYTLLLFIITFALKAEGYRISVNWKGLNDTTIYLAHYYDANIYVNDTLLLNNKGEGIFTGDSLLHQGLYMLYLNSNTYFDFLVGSDQTFSIETHISNLIDSLKVKGAKESEDFLGYQHFIKQKNIEKNVLISEIQNSDKAAESPAHEQMIQLDNEMAAFIENAVKTSKNNMYGLFLNAANTINIPEPDVDRNHPKYDSIAWFHAYHYRRDHFLDGIDFTDERILRTPLVKPKLDTYFNKILIQSPDSIIPQALKLLKKAEPNQQSYQYVTQFLINNSTQSKIMGMDAVFVAVADEVYLKGKATWADSTTLAKIYEEVYLTRPNLIGNIAPELIMESIDGQTVSLHQMQSNYIILLFYEFDCGHCKKTVPQLYNDVYLKFLKYNIDVFAVCMNDDHENWSKFVDEHQLAGWQHVWDIQHRTRFRFKYNVKSTPLLYLLDKDKKIIAKKLDSDNLVMLLGALLKEK